MKDSKTAKTLSYILVAVLLVLYIMPLLFVINISFKSFSDYLLDPIGLVKSIQWDNYKEAWLKGNFSNYFINSLLYTGVATVLTLIVSLFGAFPVARNYVKWSGFIYLFFLMSQFLPNPMVAQFKLMLTLKQELGFVGYDTKLGYILLKTGELVSSS